MTNQIKNFILEGEKEFDKLFPEQRIWVKENPDKETTGKLLGLRVVKNFISSRQISLIKMIVEGINKQDRYELGGYPADEGAYMEKSEDGEYIKLDDIIRHLSTLRDEL